MTNQPTTHRHTIAFDLAGSLIAADWTCSCGDWGPVMRRGRTTAALHVRLAARAEQHLDDAMAPTADFDALADLVSTLRSKDLA